MRDALDLHAAFDAGWQAACGVALIALIALILALV